MKKPIDPNDIKEIFSLIPDDLELEETPKVQIDVRVFQQIFAPIKNYLESQQSTDKEISTEEAIDKLVDLVEEATPYMKSREQQEKGKHTVYLLRNLKSRIAKAEGKPKK